MRISRVIFVCMFCLVAAGLTSLAWGRSRAQLSAVSGNRGIPGYLDPQTRAFTTRAQNPIPDVQPANTTRILFRVIVPININITDQPSSNTFVCDVHISTSDAAGFFDEGAEVVGTPQGCTVPVLAQWDLATPTTDTIFFSANVDSFSGTITAPTGLRSTTLNIANIPMLTNHQTLTVPSVDVVD